MQDVRIGAMAAIYTRVSSQKQEDEGRSIEMQRQTLTKWLEGMGLQTPASLIYSDSISGTSTSGRADFNRMIEDAKGGKFEYIAVFDDDRLGRNAAEVLTLIDGLLIRGIRVLIFNLQHIDIYGPEGKLLLGNKAVFSGYFSGQLSLKVKAGQAMKKALGHWIGNAPYGYKVYSIEENKRKVTRLLINEEEQTVIEIVNEQRELGITEENIANYLNKCLITTRKERYHSKLRNADVPRFWTLRMIRGIIRQRDYSGFLWPDLVYRNGQIEKMEVLNNG